MSDHTISIIWVMKIFFFYHFSMYSCHLLISFASVRSISFLSFIVPIFAWNVPLVSLIFLKRSHLFHSIAFLYFFALITEEGFLLSPCYSLELFIRRVYLSFSSLPFTFLLFIAICKASSDSHFAFLHFFFLGQSWYLSPVQCHEPPSIILRHSMRSRP